MDNQDEKADGTVPRIPSPQQQKGGDISSPMVGQEGAGGEQDGVQHTATGRERGKYKQYEDSQAIIEKIRSYRMHRYPDSEIMKVLDNMPRRTYYNYVKKLQEQDRQIMEQWMAENVEHVSEELMIHGETLCQKLREVQGVIDNENTSAKDKMQAIEHYLAISEKLVTFNSTGRLNEIKYTKRNNSLDSLDAF
jgi:DNA-binding transcriptional MerR regulator